MNDIVMPALMQLLWRSPMLLACVLGMFLAIMFWRKCPAAGLLVLLGSGLLVLSTVAWTFAYQYVVQSRAEFGMTPQQLVGTLSILGLASSGTHAVGFGLLLAAAFVGRCQRHDPPQSPF